MELREDVTVPELGNFRWLTVGVPGQDVAIALLAVPGAPVFDEDTRKQPYGVDAGFRDPSGKPLPPGAAQIGAPSTVSASRRAGFRLT